MSTSLRGFSWATAVAVQKSSKKPVPIAERRDDIASHHTIRGGKSCSRRGTMARIIDYPTAKQTLEDRGFVSLYHNSGAFGFGIGTDVWSVGWVEVADSTIRPAARALVRHVNSITETMGRVFERLPGEVWLMPKSHWHYELQFGNRELLETMLPTIGIEPASLRERNDGSPIAFVLQE